MGHTRPVEREPSHLRAVGAEPETATAGRATVGDGEALVQELVGRARSGDMQAWARLYQDHFDGLFRHLRYLTGCPQLAEELVQESFVQALCCIGKYDGRSRFSTWLHGIGLNVARHHWRSQRSTAKAHARLTAVQEVQVQSGLGSVGGPDRTMLAKQRVAMLYQALEQIPEHLREAFILRELEDLPPAEAAAQLGITTNNLAVRASRARLRIRKLLADSASGVHGEGSDG
ncbi:MAG: RNA polymerase sigma factor [Myxococcales bacterium]|nr:RNA polymerase sigma factor [Myxococcales bacterium]